MQKWFEKSGYVMQDLTRNCFWDETIKVEEEPADRKIYNSFSRPRKDNIPQLKSEIFSRGSLNAEVDKIVLDNK